MRKKAGVKKRRLPAPTLFSASRERASHSIDYILVSVVFALVMIGILMIYSASAVMADAKFNLPAFFLIKQIIWACIGFVLMAVFSVYPYGKLRANSRVLVLISFIGLAAVIVFNIHRADGIRRWITFGPLSFQPAELSKIILAVYMADYISRKQEILSSFARGILPLVSVAGLHAVLIYIQPDLGNAVLIMMMMFTLLVLAGAKWRHLFGILLASIPALYMTIFHVSYRKKRFLAFLDPWKESQTTGYQLVQSLLALGSGGIIGKGLGRSSAKLFFLPEAYSDFIFPIIGEEFGFIGTTIIIACFAIFALRGIIISARAPDRFSAFCALAITLFIFFQAVMNIAVVTACIPTKGISLPFVSFGGSSLLCNLIGVGILLNISRYTVKKHGT